MENFKEMLSVFNDNIYGKTYSKDKILLNTGKETMVYKLVANKYIYEKTIDKLIFNNKSNKYLVLKNGDTSWTSEFMHVLTEEDVIQAEIESGEDYFRITCYDLNYVMRSDGPQVSKRRRIILSYDEESDYIKCSDFYKISNSLLSTLFGSINWISDDFIFLIENYKRLYNINSYIPELIDEELINKFYKISEKTYDLDSWLKEPELFKKLGIEFNYLNYDDFKNFYDLRDNDLELLRLFLVDNNTDINIERDSFLFAYSDLLNNVNDRGFLYNLYKKDSSKASVMIMNIMDILNELEHDNYLKSEIYNLSVLVYNLQQSIFENKGILCDKYHLVYDKLLSVKDMSSDVTMYYINILQINNIINKAIEAELINSDPKVLGVIQTIIDKDIVLALSLLETFELKGHVKNRLKDVDNLLSNVEDTRQLAINKNKLSYEARAKNNLIIDSFEVNFYELFKEDKNLTVKEFEQIMDSLFVFEKLLEYDFLSKDFYLTMYKILSSDFKYEFKSYKDKLSFVYQTVLLSKNESRRYNEKAYDIISMIDRNAFYNLSYY